MSWSRLSLNNISLKLKCLFECWLINFLSLIFLLVSYRYLWDRAAKEIGLNLSLVLLDLTIVAMSSLFLTPLLSRVDLITSIFYLILSFSLDRLLATSSCSIAFFTNKRQ